MHNSCTTRILLAQKRWLFLVHLRHVAWTAWTYTMHIISFFTFWTVLVAEAIPIETFKPLSDSFIKRFCDIAQQTGPDVVRVFYDNSHKTTNLPNILRYLNSQPIAHLLEVSDYSYELELWQQPFFNYTNTYKSVNLMLISDNYETTLENEIKIVRRKMERKCLSKYVVVIENYVFLEANWLNKLFVLFWSRYILDIIVMYHVEGVVNIFTYNPFMENGFQIQNVTLAEDGEMFPQKARNLNGYNLTSVLRIVQIPMNKTREKVIEKLIKDENQLESIFEEKLVFFYQKISYFWLDF